MRVCYVVTKFKGGFPRGLKVDFLRVLLGFLPHKHHTSPNISAKKNVLYYW